MFILRRMINNLRSNLEPKLSVWHAVAVVVFAGIGGQRGAQRDIKFKFLIGKSHGPTAAFFADRKYFPAINYLRNDKRLRGVVVGTWVSRPAKSATPYARFPQRFGQISGLR